MIEKIIEYSIRNRFIVLVLAARSWVAVFDLQRPAAASAVVAPAPDPGASPR